MILTVENSNWNTDGIHQMVYETYFNPYDVAFIIPDNLTHEALTDGLIVTLDFNSLQPIYDPNGNGEYFIPIQLPRPDVYFLGMKIFFVIKGYQAHKIKFLAPPSVDIFYSIEGKPTITLPASNDGIYLFSIMDQTTFEEGIVAETDKTQGALANVMNNVTNNLTYYTDQAIDNATGGVLTAKTIINAESLEFDLQSLPAGMNIAPHGSNNRYILEQIEISSSQNGSGFVPSAGSTLVANVQGKKFTLGGLNGILGGTKRWGSLAGTFQNTDTEQNPNLPIYLSLLQSANLNNIGTWQTVGTISIEVMVKYIILNPIN